MSKKAKTLAVLIGAAVIILIVWTVSTIPEPPPATHSVKKRTDARFGSSPPTT